MSVSTLFDVSYPAYQSESIRVYDLYVDGTIHGDISPGTITPGANNTFLRTDNFGVVQWNPFILSDLPGGSTGTFLTSTPLGGSGGVQWRLFALADIPKGATGTVLTSASGSAPSWQVLAVAPSSITPGTTDQILITSGGVPIWSSNLRVPGTLGVTGASTFTGNGLFQNDLAVIGDFNVTDGDLTVGNGKLDVLVGNTTLQGVDIDGVLTFNGAAGSSGNIIVSNGSGQAWASPSFSPSSITAGTNGYLLKSVGGVSTWTAPALTNIPGTSTVNQVLQSDGAGNAVYNTNITLPGSLLTNGTFTAGGIANLNGNLQFAAVSGSSGNFVKKTGASSQAWSDIAASDIKGGTNNQVLQSNGTNAVFNTDITLPGNVVMNAASAIFQMSGVNAVALLNDTRIYGPLKFSGVAGVSGTVPVTNASGIPTWSYVQYFARYYDNNVVDMNNGGAGRTLLASASVDVANSNITYSAGTFTLAEAGHYQVLFQTNPTTSGAGAQSLINLKVNGSFAGSFTTIALASGVQSAILQKSFRVNTTSATVQIVSQQLAAGILNTSSTDLNGVATTVITITRIGPYV